MQFVEAYATEDAVRQTARLLAEEVGTPAIGADIGAMLRLLAAVRGARAVVEIGTGTGASGLWLLQGMRTDGVLTTIDLEAEHQRLARRLFAEAGYAPSRTRMITGRAQDVLPRLADGAYDMVFLDADPTETVSGVSAAERLLRPGGVLAVHGVLAGGRVDDPTARDPDTVALRELLRAVRESDVWVPALLPLGTGLLTAVRR
ncbi:putative O-methyltransferase [Pilimelia anulata]|uniref:Putative O-methyltransferase n=1 Tax=Pilimelia anulata TaxID=53371 RepID=A0A8J3FAE8_9ACTN|nr:O-methyltransferase [Pilimelia anulata]GGJ91989.1 putative O-methyltransferase [Pilimelia anulata]